MASHGDAARRHLGTSELWGVPGEEEAEESSPTPIDTLKVRQR